MASIEIEATMAGSSELCGQPIRQISVSAVLRGKGQSSPPRKVTAPVDSDLESGADKPVKR